MTILFRALVKGLPQLLVASAILGAAAALVILGTMPASYGVSLFLLVIGATGIAAGAILGGTTPNANLVPHLILALMIVALVVVCAAYHAFGQVEVVAVLSALVGTSLPASALAAQTPTHPAAPPAAPVP